MTLNSQVDNQVYKPFNCEKNIYESMVTLLLISNLKFQIKKEKKQNNILH